MWGFLFRWSLVVFGVYAVFSGVKMLVFEGTIDEDAEVVTIERAGELARDERPHFVEVRGEPDLDRRVYRTAIKKPRYLGEDTSSVHVLSPDGSNARELIGHTVEVSGTLDPRWAELQTIEHYEGQDAEDGTVRNMRVFVPLLDSAGSIVIMSPRFWSEDDPAYDQWVSHTTFTGVLADLADLSVNRPELEKSVHDVRNVFLSLGLALDPNAVILFTDTDGTRSRSPSYAPIAGSGNAVFLRIPPDRDVTDGAPLAGMIRPGSASAFREFVPICGKLPGHFAVVDLGTTAADLNAMNRAAGTAGIVSGSVSAGIGGLWIFLKRRGKRRRAERIAEQLDALERYAALEAELSCDDQRAA